MATTVILRPTSDGSIAHTLSAGTNGYLLVNETTSDGDSSYIYQTLNSTSTASKSSNFVFAHNIPSGAKIKSITMHVLARNAGNGETANLSGSVVINGTTYQVISNTTLSSSYTDKNGTASTDVIAGVISATITSSGSMSSSKGASAGYARITQVYIEVTYEEPEPKLFIQVNARPQQVQKVLKKINGSWVVQSSNNYSSLFANKKLVWKNN